MSKAELLKLWNDASRALGQVRPKNCKCRYRVSVKEGERLLKHGLASQLITDWKFNEERNVWFPAPNLNLVWGGKQAEDLGLVRSSLAQKTPRVQTVEKAHIERSVVDGNVEEAERIEVWGAMAKEAIDELTTTYWPEPFDPFKNCPVLYTMGDNLRTCVGKNA